MDKPSADGGGGGKVETITIDFKGKGGRWEELDHLMSGLDVGASDGAADAGDDDLLALMDQAGAK
jgi:hypothetical protein